MPTREHFQGSVPLLPHLCPLSVPLGGGMWGMFRKPYSEHPRSACCTDDMFQIFVRFGRCLCCVLPPFVNRQPPCPHTNSLNVLLPPLMHHRNLWFAKEHAVGVQTGCGLLGAHLPAQQKSLVHPVHSNLHATTKQRNVDLTTDGLWAMPLNSGWVPVKSRRLQDWQKLKKYVPNNKHGDVCSNGVPTLPEKDNTNDYSE